MRSHGSLAACRLWACPKRSAAHTRVGYHPPAGDTRWRLRGGCPALRQRDGIHNGGGAVNGVRRHNARDVRCGGGQCVHALGARHYHRGGIRAELTGQNGGCSVKQLVVGALGAHTQHTNTHTRTRPRDGAAHAVARKLHHRDRDRRVWHTSSRTDATHPPPPRLRLPLRVRPAAASVAGVCVREAPAHPPRRGGRKWSKPRMDGGPPHAVP